MLEQVCHLADAFLRIYSYETWLQVVPTAELYNNGSQNFSRSKARVHDRRKDTSATWIITHHVFFSQMTCPMQGDFNIFYNIALRAESGVHPTLF